MDTKDRLRQCFEKLGFSNNFPDTLHINPSTNFIWQQIINNVKPKAEVDVIRKNIIINRIGKKATNNTAHYPLQEIEIYNQLKTVKKNIAKIKARIVEKQNKHVVLKDHYNTDYVLINSMKEKNEEKLMKIHALKLKSKHYQNGIKDIEDKLLKRSVSSIPPEISLPANTIAEHLHYLVEEIEKCSMPTRSSCFNKFEYTLSQKSLCSIKKSASKSCFSTTKKTQQRPIQFPRFVSCKNLTSARALFTEPAKENNKNMTNTEDSPAFDTFRDLLPELNFSSEADDEFLLTSRSTRKEKSLRLDWNLTNDKRNMFQSDVNLFGRSRLDENKKVKNDYFYETVSNRDVMQNIEEIIDSGNRTVIWNTVCSILDSVKLEAEQNISKVRFQNKDIGTDDLIPLNFVYIKNNLLCLKSKKQIKILKNAIREKTDEIEKKLNSLDEVNDQSLLLQIDKIKLEAAVHFLHKEVYNNNTVDQQTTLQNLKTKLERLKSELVVKVEEIGDFIETKESLIEKMKKCQDECVLCVKKLKKFLFNPSWAESLSEGINWKEIEFFDNYPMDYIKHSYFEDKDTLYRDSLKDFTVDESTSKDILYEVIALLRHPHHPPEKILEEIINKIFKLQVLSSLDYPVVIIPDNQHSLEQLQEKENYISTFCEEMNILMYSNRGRNILKSSSYLKSSMDLWVNMPLRRFISKERLVDGKEYSEYEKMLDYLKKIK